MSLAASERYTSVAIALHWLMAIAIIANLGLGLYMHELPNSPTKLELYACHKSIGACILMLLLVRLAWRFTHKPPALPASMPALEQRVAHGMVHGVPVHAALAANRLADEFFCRTTGHGIQPVPAPRPRRSERSRGQGHEGNARSQQLRLVHLVRLAYAGFAQASLQGSR